MKGSFIWQKTATTGTGTITLGAALSGYLSVGDVIADGHEFLYVIRDGEDFEIGQGVYTASGTTLARAKILATFDSGVYDDTNPTAISLSGSALVTCDFTHLSVDFQMPGVWSAFPDQVSLHMNGGGSASAATTIDREYYIPFYWKGGMVDSVAVNVSTLAAGASAVMGIYNCAQDGLPNLLIQDAGTVSVATTGTKTASFTAIFLPPGWYYSFYHSNGAATLKACNTAAVMTSPIGVLNTNIGTYAYGSSVYSGTAPSPANTSLTGSTSNPPVHQWGVA